MMDETYMRVSEMYLIKAEAKAKLDDPNDANILAQMAVVRDPNYVANSDQAFIDEILVQNTY